MCRIGQGDYRLALDLVAAGKIQLKDIITHRYRFEDALQAFECMRDGKGYDGKPPIKCKSPLKEHYAAFLTVFVVGIIRGPEA